MSSTYDRLALGVRSAIDYAASCDTPPGTIDNIGKDFWASLADYPDHTVLNTVLENFGLEPRPAEPNEVVVDNPEDLRMAVDILAALYPYTIPSRLIDEQVQHEAQHGMAAAKVGFRAMQYGLAITHWNKESFGWQLFQTAHDPSRPITKLASAATTALPVRPSEGDKLRLQRMGYQGVEDVGRRAVAYNVLCGELVIPVPYGYRASDSLTRDWL
jgi:hypothetical protein